MQSYGTAHPYQLRDCLYVPNLKYSLHGERELYRIGFGRGTLSGNGQIPYLNPDLPFKAVTVEHDLLGPLSTMKDEEQLA